MSDRIIRALAYNGKVNIKCVDTTELVEEARKIHGLSPVATAALGRLLTMACLMGNDLKDVDNSITLQVKADGPIGQMSVVVDGNLNVKGYVQNPNVDLPLRSDGKLDVGGAVGKNGMLYIVKDIGLKEPYVGISPLVSGEIAEDFTSYYATSEQVPTAIALGVLVNKDGVKSAGGYRIQLMPEATEEDIARLEESLKNIKPISALSEEETSLEEIAEQACGDDKLFILLQNIAPQYRCDCSKDRIERGLISLGAQELDNIINTDGHAEIVCNFCKKAYNFSKDDLEKLKGECRGKID